MNPTFRDSLLLSCIPLALIASPAARGATYYWDNNGSDAGFGTAVGTWADPTTGDATQGWSTSSAGTATPGASVTTKSTSATLDAVNFGTTPTGLAAGTITVSGTVQVGSMTIASASGSILLSGGTINFTTAAAGPTLTVSNASAPSTISSDLTGGLDGATVTKSGGGTLYLSGNNRYLSRTKVTGGVLVLNSANALPGGGLTINGIVGLGYGDFTRPVGGTAGAADTGKIFWSGNGGFAAYGADRTVNIGGEGGFLSFAGSFIDTVIGNLGGKILILGAADATDKVIWANGLDMGESTFTRTVQVNDGAAVVDAEISGVIRGAANVGLTKSGAGTLLLSNHNTFTGTITVSLGTLALVGGSHASPVTVSSGASLGFTLGSPTASTGTFDLGAGTIKITGEPTLASYDLITSSAGITGTPVLAAPITGYELKVEGNRLKLRKPGYPSWIDSYFPGETSPSIIGTGADPDQDGLPNAVEMVGGGNPKLGMDAALLPTIELVTNPVGPPATIPAGNYLLFTYRRSDLSVAGGVTVDCETDTDLVAPWAAATGAPGVVIQEDNDYGFFTPPAAAATDRVRVYVPRGTNTTLFGHLKVVVP